MSNRYPCPCQFRPLFLALLLAMAGLTSCAGARLIEIEPLQTSLAGYHAVSFAVDERVDENVTAEMQSLQAQVVDRLRKSGAFEQVGVAEASTGRLQVQATVIRIRRVSSAARFWGGAFAGKAELTAEVRFQDEAGTELARYEVTGASGSTGVAGGTASAVAEAAAEIARLIERLRKSS